VLYLADVPKPEPKVGEVLVQVKAAGINPGEASIRQGYLQNRFPSTFPSGQGTDFAGIVTETGDSVNDFKTGDEVVGYSHQRSSHAEYVFGAGKSAGEAPGRRYMGRRRRLVCGWHYCVRGC